MYANEIIVTTTSIKSNSMEEIINSNTDFLNKLFKVNMKKNEVSKDAMQSYYVDFYEKSVSKNGFAHFMYHFYSDKKLITNIEHALYNLGCFKNLFLFNQTIYFVDRLNRLQDINYLLEVEYKQKNNLFDFFREKFDKIAKDENLIEKNYTWLKKHPQLVSVHESKLRFKLLEVHLDILQRYKEENPTHIRIIKELCEKANETYRCITAGDPNNIFNSSWYFMTESGNYYMVEKNQEAKMYSSKTKDIISSISTKSYYN